jgi:N-acetylglucosamine-6-phosphate deacetylase
MTMQFVARRFDTGVPFRYQIGDGRIVAVEPCAMSDPSASRCPWIAPGLIDIQINGYGGHEFCAGDLTPELVAQLVDKMSPFGVAQFLPTVTTAGFDVLRHSLATIGRACEESAELARRIPGIHLEGPYISADDGPRGAHPREHCRPPDWEEFERLQEAAGGRIRLVTLSAEYEQAPAFIARAVSSGVVVAIGHTAAETAQIVAATDAGARLSTHLGNGAHPLLRRHPNYIWSQLAEDRLLASLIVDGHHLSPEVVKTFVRAKSPERCILISDLSGLAGLPPGRHRGNLCEVEILPEGRIVVAGQRRILAGAGLPITAGIVNVMQFAGLDLQHAIAMATRNPARLLDLVCGDLAAGDEANLLLFDLPSRGEDQQTPRFNVRALLVHGRAVYGVV